MHPSKICIARMSSTKSFCRNIIYHFHIEKSLGNFSDLPEYVLPLADNDKGLLAAIVGVDVLQGRGHQLLRELGGQADGEWHPALQDGIGHGAVIVVIVIVSHLKS